MCRVYRLVVALTVVAAVASPAAAGIVEGKVQARDPKVDLSTFVIYVEDLQGPFPPVIQTAVMDQHELKFVPHVLPVQAGTTVEFRNSDPLMHNVFSISPAKRFNLGLYGRDTVRRIRFDRAGVVEVLCNVHQEMSAYIVVLSNPYFARTSGDGSYRIAGVPPGSHRLRCWHERLGERSLTVQVPATGAVTANFIAE